MTSTRDTTFRDTAIVETAAGRLRGAWETGLAVFRGVPYAAPPVGEQRWKATSSHPGWSGIRDALEHGPISPQPRQLPHDGVLGTSGRSFARLDEDCLSLTVWTPGLDDARRPVLVWIHGGGHITGAGSWDIYSGAGFARNGDLVVVSINYRLGPFGYLFVEEDGADRGNFWLDDMLTALRWVQSNIAAFGGDPDSVTVAGQSGGALSIAWLMGLPAAEGLFRRAILQSPPMGFGGYSVEDSRTMRECFFELLGVSSLDEARAVPAAELVRHIPVVAMAWNDPNLWIPPFWDVIDEVTLTRQPLEALAEAAEIDLMIGWTREEFSFYCAPPQPAFHGISLEQAVQRTQITFGDEGPAAFAEYANARPGASPTEVLIDIIGDEHFRMGSLDLADLRATRQQPTYVYQFEWQSPAFDGLLGATHCLELPFVFNDFSPWSDAGMLAGTESPRRQALADTMHAAWIAFIRTGDPNHDALPFWEPYTTQRQTMMRFDNLTHSVDNLCGQWRRVWTTFKGRQR